MKLIKRLVCFFKSCDLELAVDGLLKCRRCGDAVLGPDFYSVENYNLSKNEESLNEEESSFDNTERLKSALIKICKCCDHIDRDVREADKVMCGTQDIRFLIAKVYPKYMWPRKGEEQNDR